MPTSRTFHPLGDSQKPAPPKAGPQTVLISEPPILAIAKSGKMT